MKSKQKAPSLSARILKIENEMEVLSHRVLAGEKTIDFVSDKFDEDKLRQTKGNEKSSGLIDWVIIAFYIIVLVVYVYSLSKSKKQ